MLNLRSDFVGIKKPNSVLAGIAPPTDNVKLTTVRRAF